MALRAKEPTAATSRLKFLLYSPAGIGKTMAAIQMDRPYIIDTEQGTKHQLYIDKIKESKGVVFSTTDMDEVIEEVQALARTKHEFRTVVIDSFTPVYEQKMDEGVLKVGEQYGKHIAYADRYAKRLFRLLTMIDMNVVVTSHSKAVWVPQGGEPVLTFDGWKKLDYLFDLVLELQRRGKERWAVVRKTRLAQFPDLDSFMWSFNELSKRWGKESLTRAAAVVPMATEAQVGKLTKQVEALNLPPETLEKWFKKADVDGFSEMTEEQILLCIGYCEKKIAEAGNGGSQ